MFTSSRSHLYQIVAREVLDRCGASVFLLLFSSNCLAKLPRSVWIVLLMVITSILLSHERSSISVLLLLIPSNCLARGPRSVWSLLLAVVTSITLSHCLTRGPRSVRSYLLAVISIKLSHERSSNPRSVGSSLFWFFPVFIYFCCYEFLWLFLSRTISQSGSCP